MLQLGMLSTLTTISIQLYRIQWETFEGENFHDFVAIHKSFLHEIWGVAFFGAAKVSNLQKFSPRNRIFHQFANVFFLESFPLYGIWHCVKRCY